MRSTSRPLIGVQQRLPRGDAIGVVHHQNADGCPSDRRKSGQGGTGNGEMFLPAVLPGIEQTAECAGCGVNARDVRALMEVAAPARQREIFQLTGPAVLSSDDVVNHVSEAGGGLRETAVFARVSRPAANLLPHLVDGR